MQNSLIKIHIFSPGDPTSVKTWSGLPYYTCIGLKGNGVKLQYSDYSFPKFSKVYNFWISIANRISNRLFSKTFLQPFNKSIFGCLFTNLYISLRAIRYSKADIFLFFTFLYGWSTFSRKTVLLCDQTMPQAIRRGEINHMPVNFNKAKKLSELLSLRYSKCNFATTQATIHFLTDYYKKLAIHPTPILQVNVNPFKERTPPTIINGVVKKLIFIGSDPYRRGLDVLLESFTILQNVFPNILLIIIGCGTSKILTNYKTKVTNIIHHPYLDKSDSSDLELYSELLREASLFVMPQRGKLLASAMLESLYYSTPVITTNVSGMEWYVQNGYNGLLLPKPDSNDFAKAIASLLLDENRLNQMSNNAFESVKDLSPKNAAKEIIDASLAAIGKKQ